MALLNFDANTVDPRQSFDPIPAGWYKFMIVESEQKPTKDQQGAYLQLQLKVVDGEYAGRVVFDRLNLHNKNQVAVEIAYKTLSAICHATGVIQCADSQQLHGIPLEAKVSVSPANDGYDASNDVKGYRKIDGAANPAGGNAAPAFAQQQGADAGAAQQETPAWQQKPAENQETAPAETAAAGNADLPPWMQK